MTGTTWLGLGLMFVSLALLLLYLRRVGHVRLPYWGRWPRPQAVLYGFVLAWVIGLVVVTSTPLQFAVAGAAWLLLTIAVVARHNRRVAKANAA